MNQISQDFSIRHVFAFHDLVERRSVMNPNSVAARRSALNAISDVLTDDEKNDVRLIDLDDVVFRFSSTFGTKISKQTISLYEARVAAALNDFREYLKDPLNFQPGRYRKKSGQMRKVDRVSSHGAVRANQNYEAGTACPLKIPLRSGVDVVLLGLPADLSFEEAYRIGDALLDIAKTFEER